MGEVTQNNLVENFGNIYGNCSKLIGSSEPNSNTRIYEIEPNIKGNYGLPVRILTTMYLRIGTNYSIRGYLDTIEFNSLIVPILVVTKVTEIKRKNLLTTYKSSPIERAEFASFIYVEGLTVMKVSHQTNEVILTLKKETQDMKYVSILEFVSMSTYPSRKQCEELKVGDVINFLGTIHRDRKYDNDTKLFEVGVKLFSINPPVEKVKSVLDSLTVLHDNSPKGLIFEEQLKQLNKETV